MGRGKRKGQKPEEKPDSEPASDQPSTSQASTGSIQTGIAGLSIEPKPSVPEDTKKQEQVADQKEDEEEGLGLGLSGGRKRRPKKKKEPAAASVAAAPATAATVTLPPAPSTQIAGPPQTSSATYLGPPQVLHPPSHISTPSNVQQHVTTTKSELSSWQVGQGRGRGIVRGWGRGESHSDKFSQPQPGPARGPYDAARPMPSDPVYPPQVGGPVKQPYSATRPITSDPASPPGDKDSDPRTKSDRPLASSSTSATPAAATTKQQPPVNVLCRYRMPDKVPGNNIRDSRSVRVLTNYLQMNIKNLKINRYDVTFEPMRPKKMIPVAFRLVKDKFFSKEYIAFDQMKNCYSLNPLKIVPANDRFATTVEVKDSNGKTLTFQVSLKFTGIVDLGRISEHMATRGSSLNPPTEAIQCVDVILRQGTLESYVKAGRQFFKRPAKPINLGDGLEIWTGLFQSAIFTSKAFINVDVAHKGFPKQQHMIDALMNDFRVDPKRSIFEQRGMGSINYQAFVKGLRVVATVLGDEKNKSQSREFICNEMVESAVKQFFQFTDPQGRQIRMSVYDYFAKLKNYKLKYPNLNCLWVGPRDKSIYIPIELVEVGYGQPLNRQLNEMQLSTMVREAATPPDERKRKIEEVISDMKYSRNDFFKKFGLEIGDQFYQVDAKVLQAPSLSIGEARTAVPRNGVWQANKLLKAEALQCWGFIAIDTDPRGCDFENIVTLIKNTGRQMGMQVDEPQMVKFNTRLQELQNLFHTAKSKNIRVLFVIVSSRGRDLYSKVKQLAEREVGILTQCIKENTAARRMSGQTVRNILLKVNSKLMGINQALDNRSTPRCLKEGGPVMIVGADVTHPSPDQTSVPSIAAVTASIDPKCYMYNIELSIQTPKREMIVEFEDMMLDHLKVFQSHQRCLPKKIFVFRDGVSEGQFAQVMNSELTAVHKAYQRLAGPNAKPEVLFLLVQKRHHTRFFQTQNARYNVEPGTVVDKDIVHPRELDFYLVSHQAIKGTARPTRYHAVCNDGNIPSDEVEQLAFYLCHLYSRCTRSVSYPAPTYYAHLACLRARSLTFGEKFNNLDLEKQPKRLRVLDNLLQFSRMFFV